VYDLDTPVAHATGRGCAGLPALTKMRNLKTDASGYENFLCFHPVDVRLSCTAQLQEVPASIKAGAFGWAVNNRMENATSITQSQATHKIAGLIV
jgi:hypothetical protein